MPKVLEVGVPRGTAACGGVIMHGRGGTAEEMTALAGRLAAPGIRWVVPEADGGRWFPHRFMGPRSRNEPFLSEAVASCEQLVNDASDGGRIAPEQLAVVGFSQGACLASEFILRRPRRCRAVVMFTGGLIGPDDTPWAVSDGSLAGVSVLITGSDTDAWVPEERVRRTAQVLEALGAEVELRIYRGRDHLVGDEELALARAFLERTLGAGADTFR